MIDGVIYVTIDGDRLDWICSKHYGAASGFVERVLEANPGLADLGCVYDAGVQIFLPAKPAPVIRQPLKLWD